VAKRKRGAARPGLHGEGSTSSQRRTGAGAGRALQPRAGDTASWSTTGAARSSIERHAGRSPATQRHPNGRPAPTKGGQSHQWIAATVPRLSTNKIRYTLVTTSVYESEKNQPPATLAPRHFLCVGPICCRTTFLGPVWNSHRLGTWASCLCPYVLRHERVKAGHELWN
jgi:hypothetical protein